MNEFRYAFRTLRRSPAFTAVAALTLALGVGANTAIFSVAWQVLFKPLPFPDEGRLVVIWTAFGPNRRLNPVAPATFHDWATATRSFEAVAAYNRFSEDANLIGSGEPRQIRVTWVTEDFFRVLGVHPVLGRPIQPSDADGASGNVLVLGERLWRAAFNGDRRVVGRSVTLNGQPYEIVGVMPDQTGIATQAADAWVRLPLQIQRGVRQAFFLSVIARLRPGVTLAQASDDVVAVSERAAKEFPDVNRGLSARVFSFREHLAGGVRSSVLVLAGSAGLVLLIACANITGLQLARQMGRRRDMAIRAAIGATPGRLVRSVLSEGVLLALAGGWGGLLVAVWVLATLQQLAPAMFAREISAYPEAVVVLYTAAISMVSGLMFAAVPAWRAGAPGARPDLGVRGSAADAGGSRMRTMLVGLEVALAVIVLAGAGLLVASLARVLRVNPGFEFARGLVIDLNLPFTQYPEAQHRTRFFEQAVDRVEAVGGVERACVMNQAPLTEQRGSMTFVPEGQTRTISALPLTVSSGCFDVLRVPIRRGRAFQRLEPEPAIILSESVAREMWPGDEAVGKRVHLGLPDGRLLTVVGVAGDIRPASLELSYGNQVWIDHATGIFTPRRLLVRTAVEPGAVVSPIRAGVREIDRNLPLTHVTTAREMLARSLEARRFNMLLLSGYAIVALALCSVGIYGLLTQVVGQRRHEIGVRMALGAQPRDVVRHVLRGTAVGVLAGGLSGLVVALIASRLVRHMLFGVSPTDPTLYAAVMGVVLSVALAAAYAPARQAIRIDPLIALRDS
jgi:predicted permease